MSTSATTRPTTKGPGRPRLNRDDTTIRVEKPIATMLRSLADRRGVPLAQVASEILRPGVDRAFGEMLRELNPAGN